MRALTRLRELSGARVDGGSIALTRVVIGVAALLQMVDSAVILSRILDPTMMQVPSWGWLPVLSPDWLPLYLLLWCVAALAFSVGWHTSLAGPALCLVLGYSLVIDQQSYSNHVYLLILVVGLLTLAQSGNRLSVDGWLGKTRATVPLWPIVLLKIQLSIVYFFAAVAKLNLLYFSGAVIGVNVSHGWIIPLPDALHRWEVLMPLAVASIAAELFLALAFWSPRHRNVAVCVGVAMHATIALTFPADTALALTAFGLIMFALYLQFLDPAALKANLSRSYRPSIQSPTT